MGCILSARNKQAQSDDGSKNTIKLVLLGISNSGKSTLLKQMKCLYGGGFEPHEKESFKSIVAANLINGFMTIALHIENNGIRIKSKRALQVSYSLALVAVLLFLAHVVTQRFGCCLKKKKKN